MDTLTYVKQILKDHLLTSAYKQLSSLEANNSMEAIKATLRLLLTNNQNLLSKPKWVNSQRSLSLHLIGYPSSMASLKYIKLQSPLDQ
jgi:hypothetical protein